MQKQTFLVILLASAQFVPQSSCLNLASPVLYFDLKSTPHGANTSESIRIKLFCPSCGPNTTFKDSQLPIEHHVGLHRVVTFDDGSRLKVSETGGGRSRGKSESGALEYRITWRFNVSNSYDGYFVCAQNGAQQKNLPNQADVTFWYMTNYLEDASSFPLKKGFDQNGIHLLGYGIFPKVIENLYLNSRGYVLILNDLQPWIGIFYPGVSADHSWLCFELSESAKEHAGEYLSLDMRIVTAGDTKTAYMAAVNDFGHLRRPARLPSSFPRQFFQTIYRAASLKEPQRNRPAGFDIASLLYFNNSTDQEVMVETELPSNYWFQELADKHNSFITTQLNGTLFGYPPSYCTMGNALISGLNRSEIPLQSRLSASVGPLVNYQDYFDFSSIQSDAKKEYFALKRNAFTDECPKNVVPVDLSAPGAQAWFVSHLKDLMAQCVVSTIHFSDGSAHKFQCGSGVDFRNKLLDKYPYFVTTLFGMAAVALSDECDTDELCTVGTVQTAYKLQEHGLTVRINVNHETADMLLPALLTLSLAGYPLVMPVLDSISVDKPKDVDQLRRWFQIVCMLPGPRQMPFLDFKQELLSGDFKSFFDDCNNHRNHTNPTSIEYFEYLNGIMKNWIQTGEPVIRPMWWADSALHAENVDQFMIGDRYLVAPFLGQTDVRRNVYLPMGVWHMPNGSKFDGPRWIGIEEDKAALQYFVKERKGL